MSEPTIAAANPPGTSRPAPLRSIEEIIADLKEPIKQKHLKQKRQGGSELTFIPWYYATQYLDKYAPGWTYSVAVTSVPGGHIVLVNNKVTRLADVKKNAPKPTDSIQFIPKNQVAVIATISIPCQEGWVTREATGQEDDEVTGFGDSTSNSESMALRRAAAKFGLGLYLYSK